MVKKADDWSLVQNTVTKARGFVPTNFIASAKSLEKEVWFFGKIARAKVRFAGFWSGKLREGRREGEREEGWEDGRKGKERKGKEER